jgi:hypothetical protein
MFLRHPVVCIVQCSAVKAVYIDYIMRTTGSSAVNVVYCKVNVLVIFDMATFLATFKN